MSYQPSSPKKSNAGLWLGGAAILLVALIAVVVLLLNRQPAPAAPAAAVIVSAVTATSEPVDAAPTAVDTPAPASTEMPTSTPIPELGTSNLFVEYILDASGSMAETLRDGTLKVEVAKRVLTEHMRSFRPETNVGLRVYGHRLPYQQTEESCRDIELIAPPEKGQMERIVSWLQDFTVQGMTPLAASLDLAKDDFVYDASRINSIVLLSDGIETCGGDPCQLVEDLKAEGINFTIHVIGLDVDDPTRQQLMCIARAGGGKYHDAQSQQELSTALGLVQEEVTEAEVVAPPGVNTPTPVPPTQTVLPAVETTTSTLTPTRATTTPTPAMPTPTSTSTATTTAPTSAPAPPTDTPVPPTATPMPPTATPEPPTATSIPPTVTPEPPTATPPVSDSLLSVGDAQDMRTAGVGGVFGFGLFLMVLAMSARKSRRS